MSEIIEIGDLIKNFNNEEMLLSLGEAKTERLAKQTEKAKYSILRILEQFKKYNINLEIEQLGNGRFSVDIVRAQNYRTGYMSLNQDNIYKVLDKLDLILSFIAEYNFSNKETTS